MSDHADTERLPPMHPGEMLREEFLIPFGLTLSELARVTGIPREKVSRICREQSRIDAEVALRLARYFGTSAQLWLGLQNHYDLDVAEDLIGETINAEITPRLIDDAQELIDEAQE